MNFDKLPINWFDFVVLIMVLLGANKGRKHGMSEELTVSLQWAAIVFVCAFLYHPLGDMLAQSSPLSHLFCYLVAYITMAIVVKIVFSVIKKGAGGKLVGSSIFGRRGVLPGNGGGRVSFPVHPAGRLRFVKRPVLYPPGGFQGGGVSKRRLRQHLFP